MIFAIDFDGTVVKHKFPAIGEECPFAVEVLKEMTDKGHLLVLNTMRSEKYLDDAVKWFEDREIPLYGINRNPEQTWTNSPKVYAEIYIDDSALGSPNILDEYGNVHVDWQAVKHILLINKLL